MTRSSPQAHRKRHRIGDLTGWVCAYCGRGVQCVKCNPETTKGFVATLDHVIPKSKGGRFTYDNLVIACQTCNGKKADTILALTYTIADAA